MAVTVSINGTALVPQPRSAVWELQPGGGMLDGTEHFGGFDVLILRSPPSRGGTANWNWTTFENQSLTSIVAPPRGQTLRSGSATTYNSGVVGKPITSVPSSPGDIVEEVEFRLLVVT